MSLLLAAPVLEPKRIVTRLAREDENWRRRQAHQLRGDPTEQRATHRTVAARAKDQQVKLLGGLGKLFLGQTTAQAGV